MSRYQVTLQHTEVGVIPSHWEIVPFGDVCTDSAFGPRFGGDLYASDGNVATLRTTDLDDWGRISYSTMPLARLDVEKFKKHFLQPGDLIITRSGTCGRTAIFEGFHIPVLPGAFSIRFRLSSKADNRFFRYYFNSRVGRPRVLDLTTGSVQPNLTSTALLELKVPLPPLNEQKVISQTLGTLDRKIENLRRQNETLERIAQTLFKHWFVDFEFPNEDGKPYKSSGGEMVRSELGEVPAGWRVGEMEDVIEVRDGTHDSPKQTEEGFHLITSKHLKKEGIDFESAYLISESDYTEVNKRSKVHTYDILLSMIGTVGLLYFVLDQNINFAIKNIGLFKTSKNLNYAEYIFLFLSSDYGKTYFRTRLAGTTQSYLTLSSLREMPLIIPDKTILLSFQQIAKSLFGKFHANNQQIQTLTKTRDVLLPKLMSGKLRITK